MITQEDAKLVKGWATAFANAYPVFIPTDKYGLGGQPVYQVDPVYWRGLMIDFENLAIRMKQHLATSDIGQERTMDNITPYYQNFGDKLVKDLQALGLLRDLLPEELKGMTEYIGGMVQDETDMARRSAKRRAEWETKWGHRRAENPVAPQSYDGDNLVIASSAPTTGAPYVPTSEVVCRCADNHYCPVHDVQSSYTESRDMGYVDMTTPEGKAEFQRECEQGLWQIVNHPKFLELIHRSDGWQITTVWDAGGTAPDLLGVMDIANEVLEGARDDYH